MVYKQRTSVVRKDRRIYLRKLIFNKKRKLHNQVKKISQNENF